MKSNNKGFTIVELMVSMAVFGTVLLVITLAILQVTRVYYKGTTETNTQNTMRNIVDTISQSIQFNGGDITTASGTQVGTPYYFCVGDKLFSFVLGVKLTSANHVLTENVVANCASSGSSMINTGTELLSPNMRLLQFSVVNTSGDLYTINLKVAYGDDDVLNNPTSANASCKGVRTGNQFCGISEIRTTVMKRGN